MCYKLARPLLFQLNPEFSHTFTFAAVGQLEKMGFFKTKEKNRPPKFYKPVSVMGLDFPNPIGLAAGLDKNGDLAQFWDWLGFGFIELGTVTPLGQLGNSKPRLFRLAKDQALINRMGFNNLGVNNLVANVKDLQLNCKLGINIGKNKKTPLTHALQDYLLCLDASYSLADYIVINISSPNTPGLRELGKGDTLTELLLALKERQAILADQHAKYTPLVLKISPDFIDDDFSFMLDTILKQHFDGIIATNTSVGLRSGLKSKDLDEPGGLSGRPLFDLSTKLVERIYSQAGESLPIIASGGIITPDDAMQKFAKGAKLVQLYTGLIYEGPGLIKKIYNKL